MTGAALVALALVAPYAWGVHRARRPWPVGRTLAFAAGAVLLAAAVGGPLDAAADRGLEAHMVQHLLLGMLAPGLLALGAPVRLALAALHRPGRRAVARALHSRPARVLTVAPVALALPVAALLAFHLTPLFALALAVPAVHALEHAVLFWTSLLAWSVLLGVDPLPVRLGAIGSLAGLTGLMIPMVAIGAVYLSADTVLFAHYAHAANALADQHRGGDVMWIGGVAILAPVTLALGARALLLEEARQRRREAAHAGAEVLG